MTTLTGSNRTVRLTLPNSMWKEDHEAFLKNVYKPYFYTELVKLENRICSLSRKYMIESMRKGFNKRVREHFYNLYVWNSVAQNNLYLLGHLKKNNIVISTESDQTILKITKKIMSNFQDRIYLLMHNYCPSYSQYEDFRKELTNDFSFYSQILPFAIEHLFERGKNLDITYFDACKLSEWIESRRWGVKLEGLSIDKSEASNEK